MRLTRNLLRIITLLWVLVTGTVQAQDSEPLVIVPEELPPVYLPNPGMGWQHMAGDGVSILPETIAYPLRNEISWKILNPAPDTYAWDVLDDLLVQAVEDGKQFSFRVYTMIGEDFGGHQVPEWVLKNGAQLLETGDPDYANCVYQDHWGQFVNALRERYDGNRDIAFIDISGYGNFNEWSWTDDQTEWDYLWEDAYEEGTADASTVEILDAEARRRLADMFIGGSFAEHHCRGADGELQTVAYEYAGFQQTQLIMPYAGIRQSSQYVFLRRPDVGFRYDCLGRDESDERIIENFGEELDQIWRSAPVIFEFCAYRSDEYLIPAGNLLRAAHASIVHDNLEDDERDPAVMALLMGSVGYRFVLDEIRYPAVVDVGSAITVDMQWHNAGYAPVYPRMGQDFELRLALADERGQLMAFFPLDADLAAWMPAEDSDSAAPQQSLSYTLQVPDLPAGMWQVQTAVIDRSTGLPIRLAIRGRNRSGYYTLGTLEIRAGD